MEVPILKDGPGTTQRSRVRCAAEAVARPPHRLDPGTHGPELATQALQVHVDRARTDVGLRVPYRLEQLGPALHAAFALEQRAQQLEFGGGEHDLDTVERQTVGGRVEHDRPGAQAAADGA